MSNLGTLKLRTEKSNCRLLDLSLTLQFMARPRDDWERIACPMHFGTIIFSFLCRYSEYTYQHVTNRRHIT